MKRILLIIGMLVCLIGELSAQLSTHEIPVSFTLGGTPTRNAYHEDSRVLPAIPLAQLRAEDARAKNENTPIRFGYKIETDYNLQNSGEWRRVPGGRLWQLTIVCPGALSINLLYDRFWIPQGGKFFVYSEDRQHVLGAFTERNNRGTKERPGTFATGLVYGDRIVLEYFQPDGVEAEAVISVAYAVHGYRYIRLPKRTRNYEESGSCQVNINCPEGDKWQMEKNAVALIIVDGNRWCSGSLLITTAQDYEPLLLTANHCLSGWAMPGVTYDAVTNPKLNYWSFYWGYEAPSCENGAIEPLKKSTLGGEVVANNKSTDFALLRLAEDPKDLPNYTPTYLGWDRSGNTVTGGVGIHHPAGDVKKISTYRNLISNGAKYWGIAWQATQNGFSVTEGGSSGSPYINENHRIVGQLYGGDTVNCKDPYNDHAFYGKFSVSWHGNHASDPRRRLRDWLDPDGTGAMTTNTMRFAGFSIAGPTSFCDAAEYHVEPLPANATITWSTSPNLRVLHGQGSPSVALAYSPPSPLVQDPRIDFTFPFPQKAIEAWVYAEIAIGQRRYRDAKKLQFQAPPAISVMEEHGFPTRRIAIDNSYILRGFPQAGQHPTEYFSWQIQAPWGSDLRNRPGYPGQAVWTPKIPGPHNIVLSYPDECGRFRLTSRKVYVESRNDGLFSLAPNPASGPVTLRLGEEGPTPASRALTPYTVQICDGMTVLRTLSGIGNTLAFSVADLPPGAYLVRVIRHGQVQSGYLVKR